MKKTLIALFLFLACAGTSKAQGAFYRIGPFQQSGLAYVCPVPDGGTPCPSPVAIFSNSTLTTSLTNPITMTQGATVSFWVAPGQYILQFPTSGFNQIVTIGAGGVSANSPVPANQAQGPTYNILNYASGITINDAQHIRDGVTAGGGTKTVTSATANFQTTDVGKFIACVYNSGTQAVTVGTTITARNSATSVSISQNDNGSGNLESCVWYSNKADPAIRAAILAATPTNANSGDPNNKPTLGNSGTAYCPAGGYAVTVNAGLGALMTYGGSGSTIGPNFVGEGKTKCNIYVLADSTDPGGPAVLNLTNSSHSIVGGFTVDGLAFNFPFTHPVIGFTSTQHVRVFDIELTNINGGGANKGSLDFTNSSDVMLENVFVQGASSSSTDYACGFFGVSSSHFKNLFCSNHNQTAFYGSSGGQFRSTGGDNAPTFENATFDECNSSSAACTVFTAGYANFIGGWLGVGNSQKAMSLDGTSKVWATSINCGQYGSSASVSGCASLAAGAKLYLTDSTVRGNTTGIIFTGPNTASLFDLGGNDYQNCVAGSCSAASLAQSFSGGLFATFPLPPDALTQLGARQIVSGTAPTCSVTGAGSTATCTVDTGGTDASGKLTITANGSGIAALGTFTLTFTTASGAYGTNGTACTGNFMNGTGTWNARAGSPIFTTLGTTTQVANWDNNAVVLTSGSTYKVTYGCYGQ